MSYAAPKADPQFVHEALSLTQLLKQPEYVVLLPAELVCSRLATTTQELCAHLPICCAIHLPAEAAVHSTQECSTAFGDLYPVAAQGCYRLGYSIRVHGQCCTDDAYSGNVKLSVSDGAVDKTQVPSTTGTAGAAPATV